MSRILRFIQIYKINSVITLLQLNYVSQLLETPLLFISLLIALIDTCARKQALKFNLSVKIDLVEEVYYLKLVFHLLFYKI